MEKHIFDLFKTIHVLEVLMERMERVNGRVYLDLRPNECFCIFQQFGGATLLKTIIHALEIFVRLANLFGCTEVNVLIEKHGDSGKESAIVPIQKDGYWETYDCSNFLKVEGVHWVPVSNRDERHDKKVSGCIWTALIKQTLGLSG